MAESSETSLRDAQILDGDGALANEAANKYLMEAHAEAQAAKILQPECRVYGTANRQTASLQFLRTKCMTIHRQGGFCHEAGFVLGQGTKPTLVIGPLKYLKLL